MKETKFYPLLTLSVIFLMISLVLLGILGYNFYTQSHSKKIIAETKVKAPEVSVAKTRDSLQQAYTAAVNSVQTDAAIDSAFSKPDSSLNVNVIDSKLSDYYRLKNEISALLKDSTTSTADLDLARLKIKQLQLKVDELKLRNTDVENENKRLRAMLEQFSQNNTGGTRATDESTPVRVVTGPQNNDAVFNASEIKIAAADENNTEVASAEQTEKFVGSMVVRNTLNNGVSELMLVLIQPDGKVLRNAWESGSFDAEGGKKIYSRKIKFDYNKGESRKLDFYVPLDSCQKGTYTLQVYSKGKIIGRAVKVVS